MYIYTYIMRTHTSNKFILQHELTSFFCLPPALSWQQKTPHIYIYILIFSPTYISYPIHIYIYVYIYVYIYMDTCILKYIYRYLYICIYVYVYTTRSSSCHPRAAGKRNATYVSFIGLISISIYIYINIFFFIYIYIISYTYIHILCTLIHQINLLYNMSSPRSSSCHLRAADEWRDQSTRPF